jgi:hypothetical protein
MPDPQQNAGTTSSAQTTTPGTTAGPDLTGLRVRSLQQAKAELPQPKITPPWEDEPELKLPPTSKLGQAYEHAKQFLDTHEQHLSEKYLAPFRTGLDRMAEDLEYAGESGHTKSGGTLTGPTRALASGAGAALRMVPIGKDVKETALMSVVPPELGPETKAAFKELKTGERVAEKVAPNLEGLRVRQISTPKELPPQPRLPDTGTHAAIKTDDGSIYFDANPDKQRTHIMLAQDLKIPPERVVSGGWLQDGHYEGSIRSDAGKWGEQARAKAAVSEKRAVRAGGSTPQSPNLEGLRVREVSPAPTEKSKVVSPAKETPKPPQHEAVGIHSDDLPRRAKYQDVDFSAQDLQDSAKKVTPETIRKDYAGGKKDVSVYQAHIPMEDLPSAKFVEPEEENFDRGEYNRPRVGVPIKVAVNKDGSLEILDGNHRAQTWEEQGQEYAPAWVIDRRGAGIEKLSEDELAERAEEEAERQSTAKAPSSQSEQRSILTPEGAQPLADKLGAKVVGSVATGKTSPDPYGINRGPKDLDLRIEGDYKPDEIIPKLKAEGFEPRGSSVVSPEEVKKSGKDYGGPGWKRIEHFENAVGHKVDVFHDGAAKSWEIHDLGKDHNIPSEEGYLYHATNHERAHDIAESGLDTHKPSYGTDQEAWPDGSTDKRSYFTQKADHAWQFAPEEGKPALLRMKQDPAIHSRESTGDFYSKKKIPANKIEVLGDDKQWHPVSELSESNAGSQTDKLIQHVNKKDWYHVPPAEGQAAYAKRGQFFASNYKDAEFYGRPLDEAQNPQIKKPLVGDEATIGKELGIAPQKEGMTREEIAEHDKQWGSAAKQKGYDSILLMSPDQWKEFQSSGKIPRSLELQHLDKLETAPKVPVHEKLFSQALEAVGPGTKQSAAKIKGNYSSESEASTEAISRLTSEKKGGIQRLRVDSRSGREVPLVVGVGNIDVRPGPYDYIIQRGPQGDTILDAGQRARPFRPKQRP